MTSNTQSRRSASSVTGWHTASASRSGKPDVGGWAPGTSNSGFNVHGGFGAGQSQSVNVFVDVPGSSTNRLVSSVTRHASANVRYRTSWRSWSIDLRLTPDGKAVCFEVNPSPAYRAFEDATRQPIAAALARYLAGV